MSVDDELAQTATAPACTPSASSSAGERPAIEPTLGRYVIERALGAGGMGVVYAAFDPDLERRVAIKVLRNGLPIEAEQRLLNEARAMARLAHPNVVTVYEVGSSNGRDYVAMELVEGEPLVDWLRAEQRTESQIIAVFADAGRGLAAAHAAGIVHRDFKPHNVLRGTSGRIAVTDFGLAREVVDPTEPTKPVQPQPVASRNTPTSLSGLTVPGALLGTPAYMAPEQWNQGKVTPATDQFSYCVALWEALTGERPFTGPTAELLREQVIEGPAGLDASKLPRRLRAVLLRGLDPDPGKRWPSMYELLARLAPARRWPWVAAAVGAAVMASVLVVVLSQRADVPRSMVAGCEAPALDPDTVWNPAVADQIRAKAPHGAELLAAVVTRWRAARADACAKPDGVRRRELECLDRVLARIDAIRRARTLDLPGNDYGIVSQVYEPSVCSLADPPKLPGRYSDAAVVGFALRAGAELSPEVVKQARSTSGTDPCAAAYFAIFDTAAGSAKAPEEAKVSAQLCGDEQAYAAATLNLVARKLGVFLPRSLDEQIREAERAVSHAAQPFLIRQFERFRGEIAVKNNALDEALAHFSSATDGNDIIDFQLSIVTKQMQVLLARNRSGDLEQLRQLATTWRARVLAHDRAGWEPWFDWIDATAQWLQGDVARATPRILALQGDGAIAAQTKRRVMGIVVDARGAPVAGARVALGDAMVGDSVAAAVSLFDLVHPPGAVRRATTDSSGRFVFENAPQETSELVAQHGSERSVSVVAGTNVRLELRPTSVVSGHVSGLGERSGGLFVYAVSTRRGPEQKYRLAAPVQADGSFRLEGVERGEVRFGVERNDGQNQIAVRWRTIEVSAVPTEQLELATPSRRELIVLVRGTSSGRLDGAEVFVRAGTVAPKTYGEIQRLAGQNLTLVTLAGAPFGKVSDLVAPVLGRGDVIARFTWAPTEAATICAYGFQIDADDPTFWDRFYSHEATFELRCKPLAPDATVQVIEVPPMQRLD